MVSRRQHSQKPLDRNLAAALDKDGPGRLYRQINQEGHNPAIRQGLAVMMAIRGQGTLVTAIEVQPGLVVTLLALAVARPALLQGQDQGGRIPGR